MPNLALTTLAYGVSSVLAASYSWTAPSATDVRSPCPLLNTLANHGYLPHDGKNIDIATLITGMDNALNLGDTGKTFFTGSGNTALTVTSTGNASTFNLNDLNTHNLIEHDGSLSRADIAQGDNWTFNETIFDETKSYWPSETISLKEAATALKRRQASAVTANPAYNLTQNLLVTALGQTAMYLGLFGNYVNGTANTAQVIYFFEEEKLPFELGWKRRADDDKITQEGITLLTQNVYTNYLTV